MNEIIDQAWASLLAAAMKKRTTLRPEMGDEIDLCLTQARLLSLVAADPAMPGLIHRSAQATAQKNAQSIVKRLGMPLDYFWKFEYWPKSRALNTLRQLIRRIFSAMFAQANEGNMEVIDLDIDPLRFSIDFTECAECAGIAGLDQGICFYHAGTFSGILSALIGRDLIGYESTCHSSGDESCRFIIGPAEDTEVRIAHDAYLIPPPNTIDVAARVEQSLEKFPVRALGNSVDVSYHQLAMASTLSVDPQRLATVHADVGARLGHHLVPILTRFYEGEELQNVGAYYEQLGHSLIELWQNGPRLELALSACPDCAGANRAPEMASFLLAEIRGLISGLAKTEMTLDTHDFDQGGVRLVFSPED